MALDPKLVQYQAATMKNEAQAIVDQANTLKPQVDATLAPAVQAVADAAQTTVGKSQALIDAAQPVVTQPNLRPTKMLLPASPKTGNPYPLGVTVVNDGAAIPAGVAIGVAFNANGTKVSWASTDIGLAPGASMDLRTDTAKWSAGPWTPTATGDVTIEADVDDVNRIVEGNETDNVLSGKVTVTGGVPPVDPPKGPRAAALHLFPYQGGQNRPGVDPAVAWCNMPVGDQATFDPRPIPFGGAVTLNKYTYGLTIAGNVGYTSTAQHDNVENHTVIVSQDRTQEQNHYGYPGFLSTPTHLRDGGDLFNNVGGSGITFMAGAIRYADIQQGAINHAIALWVPWSVLDKNATHVWPARRVDNWHTNYAGWVPMGALLAIPANVPKPAGLSATGSMIWDAFRNFGGVLRDTTGQYPGSLHIEAYNYDKGVAFNAGEIAGKIMSQLRMVTNQSPDGTNNNPNRPVGGPGKRLAPYLDVV